MSCDEKDGGQLMRLMGLRNAEKPAPTKRPQPYRPEDLDALWELAAKQNRLRQPPELPPARRLLWPRPKTEKGRKRFVQPSLAPIRLLASHADMFAHHKGKHSLPGTRTQAVLDTAPRVLSFEEEAARRQLLHELQILPQQIIEAENQAEYAATHFVHTLRCAA
jgi:hypothetical protein